MSTKIKISKIHGKGLFANADLEPGHDLGYYMGERFPSIDEAAERWKPGLAVYFWGLSNGEMILGGTALKFINHSCEPNVEAVEVMVEGQLEVQIQVSKPIPKNAELLLDYNLTSPNGELDIATYKCRCGAATCRGTMIGEP